jgi:TonB family protein
MSARALRFEDARFELDEVKARTRYTMSMSVALHLALLLWLVLMKPIAEQAVALTEITLLGPGDLDPMPAAAGAPAPASAAEPVAGVRVASTTDEHFQRVAPKASFAPDPQSAMTLADRMSARLAALRQDTNVPVASGSTTGAPSAMWSTPAGVPGGTGSGGKSLSLSRGGGGSGPPLSLGRGGGGTGYSPALAAASAPPVNVERPATAEGDSHARRTLAGAQLAGPIADRAVLQHVTPVYPEWAKRDGVEGAVTLYFVVRPDGSVKENILVQKTAGFAEFDDNARAALAAWKFEPLHGGRTGEQWGTITFHYRLRDK